MQDSSAIQQGINASASQVGDSDDEWEDLDDVGFPGSKKGIFGYIYVIYTFSANTIILDLMALGDEGSGRQSRIRDDETNVSSRLLQMSKIFSTNSITQFLYARYF